MSRRAVLAFCALVLVLLAPWPRLGRGFGAAFSVYGNTLVAATSDREPTPRFAVPARGVVGADEGGDWAVTLSLGERVVPLDTRIIAYTPLAIFLALTLATPAPRRRKLLVLAGGGVALLARLALAVLVPLSAATGASGRHSLGAIAWTILVTPPVMSYAAPLAAWGLALALTTPRPQDAVARRTRARPRSSRSAPRA